MSKTIITSKKTWRQFFSELWEYREVFVFLGWRDILVQYKETVLGVVWIVLRPLLTTVAFTLVFNRIIGIQSTSTPYGLLVFSGMLVWQFFSDMLTFGSNAFLSNQQLISKVYFPRLLLPASRIICSLVDFCVTFVSYLIISIVWYGIIPNIHLIYMPLLVLWLIIFSFSISLLMASLIVLYRDIKHTIPFAIQCGMFITPIGYDFSVIPEKYKVIFACNPLVGIINGFRFILFNMKYDFAVICVSSLVTIVLLCGSLVFLKKVENIFADTI